MYIDSNANEYNLEILKSVIGIQRKRLLTSKREQCDGSRKTFSEVDSVSAGSMGFELIIW